MLVRALLIYIYIYIEPALRLRAFGIVERHLYLHSENRGITTKIFTMITQREREKGGRGDNCPSLLLLVLKLILLIRPKPRYKEPHLNAANVECQLYIIHIFPSESFFSFYIFLWYSKLGEMVTFYIYYIIEYEIYQIVFNIFFATML